MPSTGTPRSKTAGSHFGAFGSYTTWLLLGAPTELSPGYAFGLLMPAMLLGGVLVSVGTALAMERFAYRPLRSAPRLAPLISAIGISIALQEVVRLFYGRIPGFPDSRRAIPFPVIDGFTGRSLQLGPVSVQYSALFTLVALALCTAVLWWFINRTRMGRAMQATSQDADTSRLMGINVDQAIFTAFGVGAALAAVAGMAHGLRYNNIDFQMGFLAGLKAFTAAVLGGIGNINGAVVGGLVLGVVEAFATTYIPGQFGSSAWKDVWAFAILILVLVFRPQGLLGTKVVDRA